MDDWDPGLLDLLAAERRVIVFDNAGVGESEGTVQASLEGAADTAAAFARALKLERADFAGWSMGGMTAQILAIKHPALVRKLALLGTLPPGGTPEVAVSPPEWGRVAGKSAYDDEDILYLFFTNSAASRAAGQASLARMSKPGKPGSSVKTTPQVMQAQLGAIIASYKNEGGWYQQLRNIQAPTLVANGDRDGAFPVIDSLILYREIPQAQLAIYSDAGHGFHFQYPERFATDLLAFLR
jgi:pimeloyl-ACP methyl ester carboxylesterase